jgi:hypothetical protein
VSPRFLLISLPPVFVFMGSAQLCSVRLPLIEALRGSVVAAALLSIPALFFATVGVVPTKGRPTGFIPALVPRFTCLPLVVFVSHCLNFFRSWL